METQIDPEVEAGAEPQPALTRWYTDRRDQRQAREAGKWSRGRWIGHWEPESPAFWQATGKAIARKNLALSIFSEHLGFSVWVLWTIVVINLANIGRALRGQPTKAFHYVDRGTMATIARYMRSRKR